MGQYTPRIIFSFFKSSHRHQIACSLLGGFSKPRTATTQSLDSGLLQYVNLVCRHAQSSALAPLHSAPLDPLALLSSSRSSSPSVSFPVSDPDVVSVSVPFAFAFPQSIPDCSHHLKVTLAPYLGLAPLHRSRSGRVAMYCATVFCLLWIDVRMSVSPASSMAPFSEGQFQSPSRLGSRCSGHGKTTQ